MNRRDFPRVLISLLAAAKTARAQERTRLATVGYLGFRSSPNELDEAFVAALRTLGYAEDRNISLVRRFAGGSADQLDAFAGELVAIKPEVLVASSFQGTAALARLTKTIPIVFSAYADPVGAGHVATLARPGGNITGLATLAGDLGAKQCCR